METKIENGNPVISIPLHAPRPSATGKTLIVASTGGNVVTSATIDGKPVAVGLNAYVRKGEAEVVKAKLARVGGRIAGRLESA